MSRPRATKKPATLDASPTEGWIYLGWAEGTDLYKVGRSKEPARRRIASPLIPLEAAGLELVLLHQILADDAVALERRLHEEFSSRWIKGEWFRLLPEEVAMVRRWGTCKDVLDCIGPSTKRRLVVFLDDGVMRRAARHAKRVRMNAALFAETAIRRFCCELEGKAEEVAGIMG